MANYSVQHFELLKSGSSLIHKKDAHIEHLNFHVQNQNQFLVS